MAKKTFSPVEQHVEKAVLGVAALILVMVAALFLVSTPNTVVVGGQERGPGDVGLALKAEADNLRRRLQTAQAEAESVPDFRGNLLTARERGPLGMVSGIPPQLRLVTGFGAEVPDVADIEDQGGKIGLAEVIACSPPAARTGKLLGVPVKPAVLTLEAGGRSGFQGQDDALAERERQLRMELGQIIAEDMYWVCVANRFDLAAQREAMRQRGYDSGRTDIMVTRFHLQRQQLQPDGMWSDWQDVEAYQSVVLPQPPDVAIGPDDKLPSYQWELVRAYKDIIQQYQPTILHPQFEVEFHAGDQPEPPELPGLKERLAEIGSSGISDIGGFASRTLRTGYGSTAGPGRTGGKGDLSADADKMKMAGGASDVGRPSGFQRGPTPGPAGFVPGEGPQDLVEIRKQFKDAEEAFEKGDLDEAARLAQEVRGKLPDPLERQLDQLMVKIDEALAERDRKRVEQELARVRGTRQAQQEGRLGEWLEQQRRKEDFLWAYDLSITPGRTYRYRSRVILYNWYVGVVSRVVDRADAEKIQLVGAWSDPSEPIDVEDDTYFYLASGDPANKEARVDVYKWFLAQWHKQQFRVGVGEPIGAAKRVRIMQPDGTPSERPIEVDFRTGAVLVDLDFDRDATVMEPRGTGQFELRANTGALAMVYLDSEGSLGERLNVLDSQDPTHLRLRSDIRSARPRRVDLSGDTDRQPSRTIGRQPAVDRRSRASMKDTDAAKMGGRRR
ncbi:MAG TPA: hypothetical protein VMZ31_03460 [Phycisphaerae bacterium]|nr:hypothetical protein [Phycisphaerae bacterium]